MKAIDSAACESCPVRNSSQLVRLGINLDNVDYVVALGGNPNVGKSTVFNALTGLRQHTGNWPGKTVTRAEGGFSYGEQRFKIVDLPGTYSLLATSQDEEVARDFLLFGQPDVTVIVLDATRLERNLNLALQVMEITDRVVICLNLMDEAKRHGLVVDHRRLARDLGVPVVPAAARRNEGIESLLQAIHQVATGEIRCRPHRPRGTDSGLEKVAHRLEEKLQHAYSGLPNSRWVALRLLDGDERLSDAVKTGELGDILGEQRESPPSETRDVTPERAPPAANSISRPGDRSSGDAVAGHAEHPKETYRKIVDLASHLRWEAGQDFHQKLVESIYAEATRIADRAVTRSDQRPRLDLDRTLDRLLTSRWTGFPIMVALLGIVLWLTVAGANVPSALLASLLIDTVYPALKDLAAAIGLWPWLSGLLIDGMYLATAWVVSVMLPPMAIFFPLFTLLEDFGYLPRVAFNLDAMFRRVGAHGKQALTMTMGFGCNAAGVIATRVIDSPRERLIAIITNNFSLCNGRWPTQILIATIFVAASFPSYASGLVAALAVLAVALLGVGFTFASSWVLSRTLLEGEASAFSLELPPYRPPRILQTIYTSLIDRTVFVLWRAVVFALPAGAAIWLIGNVTINGASLAEQIVGFLDPVGVLIGLNGVILLAFVVAIPANEIVIPTVLMLTAMTSGAAVGAGPGVMFELDSDWATAELLARGGWTLLTGVCLMLFSLLHNPCSTTIYTIYKETRSVRWTAVSVALPLVLGFVLCFLVAQTWQVVAG